MIALDVFRNHSSDDRRCQAAHKHFNAHAQLWLLTCFAPLAGAVSLCLSLRQTPPGGCEMFSPLFFTCSLFLVLDLADSCHPLHSCKSGGAKEFLNIEMIESHSIPVLEVSTEGDERYWCELPVFCLLTTKLAKMQLYSQKILMVLIVQSLQVGTSYFMCHLHSYSQIASQLASQVYDEQSSYSSLFLI